METYHWVVELIRFAHNIHEAVIALAEILGSAEVLTAMVVVFIGFLYGVYAFARKGEH